MSQIGGGYAGQLLFVNLTEGVCRSLMLDRSVAETFIGGRGFNAKFLLDSVRPGIDPFSPENLLIIATGPLNGTPLPSASRLTIGAKSPMTGGIGDANSGGYFAPELKYAGFDAVIVEGISKDPVYLMIEDKKAELRPASHLWGLRIKDTSQRIKAEIGNEDAHICSIGPAGENQVRYACIVTDEESVGGRCGMGAVMGSKKLKAVVTVGTRDIEIADPKRFKHVVDDYIESLSGEVWTESLRKLGTPNLTQHRQTLGIWGAKNFQRGTVEPYDQISGETFRRRFLVKPIGCMGCFVRCRRYSAVTEGRNPFYTKGPEYETIHALAAKPLVTDPEAVLRAHYLCDELGMDEQTAGSSIAMAMELFERGILNKQQTDGHELVFGNHEAMLDLIEKIACRQGFGDLLAEGTRIMGQRLDADYYALHVKGLEVDAADPRKQETRALTYAVATRGACHLRGNPYIDEFISPEEAEQFFGTSAVSDVQAIEGKGKMVAWSEDWASISDLLGLCKFAWYRSRKFGMLIKRGLELAAEAFSAATGIETTPEAIYRCGERVYNLEKLFNLRENIGRESDFPPARFFREPISEGPAAGEILDPERYENLLKDYYIARGWDSETGEPTDKKIKDLGLEQYKKS